MHSEESAGVGRFVHCSGVVGVLLWNGQLHVVVSWIDSECWRRKYS